MHINNISKEISIKNIIVNSILGLSMTIIFSPIFFMTYMLNNTGKSFIENIMTEIENGYYTIVIGIFFCIIIQCIFYIPAIIAFYKRKKALIEFNKVLNIKSVDLSEKNIVFNYNRENLTKVIDYNDLTNVELVIKTQLAVTKHTHRTVIEEIRIVFRCEDDVEYIIRNTPANYYKFLNEFIYFASKIKYFSYRFVGSGDKQDLIKLINKFKQGAKCTNQKKSSLINLKSISIILFVIGVIIFLIPGNSFEELADEKINNYIITSFTFIIVSFLIDAYYIIKET